MDVFTMVVIVVIVGCVTGVISDYLKNKHKYASKNTEELDDALDRIDDLEERIRVLEKVVTDDKYELNREIDRLRDS
ncbi:MAG: hypothetical protein U5O39_16165 [Gammaproteobacteria bacterium]|nr:hypothetical protein [Gammaproteobacteria bacterium]